MRNMSFSLTTDQIRQRSKFVTRRLGWKNLKPGELFQAVEKAQGLKAGEKVVPLGILRCDSNFQEQLHRMTEDPEYGAKEVVLEGFPEKTPEQFVDMFCEHNDIQPSLSIQRIQFSYVVSITDHSAPFTHLLIPGREVEWESADGSRYNAYIISEVGTDQFLRGTTYRLKDKRDGSGGKITSIAIKNIFISA